MQPVNRLPLEVATEYCTITAVMERLRPKKETSFVPRQIRLGRLQKWTSAWQPEAAEDRRRRCRFTGSAPFGPAAGPTMHGGTTKKGRRPREATACVRSGASTSARGTTDRHPQSLWTRSADYASWLQWIGSRARCAAAIPWFSESRPG